MFSPDYQHRRRRLMQQLSEGLIVLPANGESPMNYADNAYPYRQDSTFLYFCGLKRPDLCLVLDVENGTVTLYGDDVDLDHIVWMGPQPAMRELAEQAGIERTAPFAQLAADLQGRKVHYLPPYRADRTLQLAAWLNRPAAGIRDGASEALIRAVVDLRSIKEPGEIGELERAVIISGAMHRAAMRGARAGQLESETAGLVEGIAVAAGGRMSYPAIVSINGQILHNHYHGNRIRNGQLMLIDAGAETDTGYAGDITRTFPVADSFSSRQREVYEIVLRAQERAIEAMQPGVPHRDVHLLAARVITEGLQSLGLMRGNVDEAVAAGAHALFFPHGLGHMIGLDVHDMEDLGEDFVGYDETIPRDTQFGLRSLRLGRVLQPGFALTVEPGIYFIPPLMERWQAEDLHAGFINYDKLEAYRDFGGIRIEDNVIITENGHRILGDGIPKSIEEVEALRP